MFTYMQSFSFNIREIKNRMSYYSTACAWDTVRMQSWYRTHYNKLRSFLFGKSKRLWATALVSPSEFEGPTSSKWITYWILLVHWHVAVLHRNILRSAWNATNPAIQLPRVQSISTSTVLYCSVSIGVKWLQWMECVEACRSALQSSSNRGWGTVHRFDSWSCLGVFTQTNTL